ncbi:hypothetical protein [Endozoicomonas sp. GU-1]|uniref:hypothetical protein n=1 Tax=Endozoicomonas sp. GU-1 TaxID=3009078 RepID=UPI0022B5B2A7|nr:hypothetical protein [Endozoicomonas sp. GU-1]WBA80270.1 hypothetical protein O2T12_18285 [Endozoicomonas sp. GU-1]
MNGRQVTPDLVIMGFPDTQEGKLARARFKTTCCLKNLLLNGRQVTPDEAARDFPDSPESTLGLLFFKAECCLRGLMLNGLPVTPEAVVQDYQTARATMALARFKEQCCLKGLTLNGRLVSPEAVVKAFPDSPEGKLEIARFTAECCLKGLALSGWRVTPEAVIKKFPASPEGKLGLTHFKAECCLRGVPLNGRQVTPDEVVQGFPDSPEGKLGIARFKADCCLRSLPLNGEQLTPDLVVTAFPDNPAGKLGLVRFKAECCLKGLPLAGQPVTPDAVVKDFQRGGWLFENAIFYALLALNGRALNDSYLDNQKVLSAFNKALGNYSLKQAEYLIQRLVQSQRYNAIKEAREIIHQAWQILNGVPVKEEQRRLQCILQFIAMQLELPIDHQKVSAAQVWQSIQTLRCSFQKSQIHFFFLAHCCITGQPVNERQIDKDQVLEYLKNFPEGSNLRKALGSWFEQCRSEDSVLDCLLFKRENAFISDSPDGCAV